MFSKREFRRFLAEVRAIEEQMIACYDGILRDLEDQHLRKTFQGLRDSETRHADMLKEIEAR